MKPLAIKQEIKKIIHRFPGFYRVQKFRKTYTLFRCQDKVSLAPVKKTGSFRYSEIPWVSKYLRPLIYSCYDDLLNKQPLQAEPVPDDETGSLLLAAPESRGKITDAGYDQMKCHYIKIPADRDVFLTAVIRVVSLPETGKLTGQEGGGLFIRDTMDSDAQTGFPYSNMLLAGVCKSGWKCFLRTGISDSLEHVSNSYFEPESICGQPVPGTAAEVTLIKIGSRLFAGIRKWTGDENHREPWDTEGLCDITADTDIFRRRDRKWLYVGFLAAYSCAVEILKDSVRLDIKRGSRSFRGISQPVRKVSGTEETVPSVISDDVHENEPGTVFVSPEGSRHGAGSAEDPLDLCTAVSRCIPGQTIKLRPGKYYFENDVILREIGSSGSAWKKLECNTAGEGFAVLDFRGTSGGLVIGGCKWDLRGIAVVRGMGFQIRGSDNRVSCCVAAHNLETGFLIRHSRNDSPREEWPSRNVVSDCVSYDNRDPSEKNADGFACKVSSGEGNIFRRCKSFLNSDDGFDLFSKNRAIGAVVLEDCRSWLNGYCQDNGVIKETAGNGNGFKLGGSGMMINHKVINCEAAGNKRNGFTSNSNPWLYLENCVAGNNHENYHYYFTSHTAAERKVLLNCSEQDDPCFSAEKLLEDKVRKEMVC